MQVSNTREEPFGAGRTITVSDDHTFGTDAVLLAHFAAPRPGKRAADFGTGCAVIPLLWLARGFTGEALGVDISAEACTIAAHNADINGFSSRLRILNCDIRKLRGNIEAESFELVTCNPPYFTAESGYVSPSGDRARARSELTCNLEDVCKAANLALVYGGRLCICHRPERLCDVLCTMRAFRLEPKRLRFVQDKEGRAPWLFLLEARKGGKPSLLIMPPLIMKNSDGTRTEELREIYGDYGEGVI